MEMDITPDQKVTVEKLTHWVRMWNISVSGCTPITLEVGKWLKQHGEGNLDPEECRILRYSNDSIPPVKSFDDHLLWENYTNWWNGWDPNIKEGAFVTKVNQERLSCSYIANISNSLKHLTDFLEPETMNPELLPIAKQTNKVCCHIANGFSRKTKCNVKFRNMLQEERDKLIDLKQLNEKFLNGEKHSIHGNSYENGSIARELYLHWKFIGLLLILQLFLVAD